MVIQGGLHFIKTTLKTVSKYTYGKLNAFNISELTFYSESGYIEPTLRFSISFNSSDFTNIKAVLDSALTELKEMLSQESIYYEISDVKGYFI